MNTTIFSYYLENQKDPNWKKEFQSTGAEAHGKIYPFTSTNIRNITGFLDVLDSFKGLNKSRKDWEKKEGTGQELDKHKVVALRNAKLIIQPKDTDYYTLTEKGKVFKELNEKKLSNKENIDNGLFQQELWLLIYLLLLDYGEGKYDILDISNIYKKLLNNVLSEEDIISKLKYLLIYTKDSKDNLFKNDMFWYISFAYDKDFLQIYKESSIGEKERLQQYVLDEKNNNIDCIAHKYIKNGAFNVQMFRNEALILYLTIFLKINNKPENFENFIAETINEFGKIATIRKSHVRAFINEYKTAYENTYRTINSNLR